MIPAGGAADAARYNAQDAASTLGVVGEWWEQLLLGRTVPAGFEDLLTRQTDAFTSALGLESAAPSIENLHHLSQVASRRASKGADLTDLLAASLELVHEGGRLLRAAGSLPSTDKGTVAQVNSARGGVPKRPMAEAMITVDGIEGDKQNDRRHHGRPWQAICLWSAEVIDAFAAEGHPIAYGNAGENITVRGIPWGQVQSGVRLQVGEALLEATLWAIPCSKNAPWFIARDFNLMHQDHGPVSRMYASVLRPGLVHPGDDIILEP